MSGEPGGVTFAALAQAVREKLLGPETVTEADLAKAVQEKLNNAYQTGDLLFTGNIIVRTGFLACEGQAVSRTTYKALFEAITLTLAGHIENGSKAVTGLPSTANIKVGMPISGLGIPAGTTVEAVNTSTEIHISKNATETAVNNLCVAPYGVGDGSTTFNLPNYVERTPIGPGSSRVLGSVGGEATHVLTEAEMPSHVHNFASATIPDLGPGSTSNITAGATGSITQTGAAGGGEAHNNMQPYEVCNVWIKT